MLAGLLRGYRVFKASASAAARPLSLSVRVLATDSAGRILLVRHTYAPGWHLPGGGVGHGETAEAAALRELKEEVGLTGAGAPELTGLYLKREGRVADHVVLYRVRDVTVTFRPSLEIAEIVFADPATPGVDLSPATARRLAEFLGRAPRGTLW